MGRLLIGGVTGAIAAFALAVPLAAQPPSQDAEADTVDVPLPHISRVNGAGAVVQRDIDEVEAVAGEHLAFGDRLTTGDAQVQVIWSDGSPVALDRQTSVAILSPELLAVTAGRVLVVTPREGSDELRVDVPAASVLAQPGSEVRISLDGDVADIQVAYGSVEVRHQAITRLVAAGEQLTVRDGVAPGAARPFNTAAFDSFVSWAQEPVLAAAQSPSRPYLGDPRLEAYADVFDRYGAWETDPTYGQVWYPAVAGDWRPYWQGYWQPFGGAYGPTWVGLDPWGWPTHHYGAWDIGSRGRWFWRPGRRWSPGRVHWSVGPGYIGWSPRGLRASPHWAWSRIVMPPRATQRGVYPAGTLDPYRAWTIVPTERYGRRGGLSPYAVDARTLGNLDAFVTQRVAPPFRVGGTGSWTGGYPVAPGTRYPGRATGRGGYGTPTGVDSTADIRRGVPRTRIAPPTPGPGAGPTPPPDDPYERAREVMTPRGRQRVPPAATGDSEGATTPQRVPETRRPPASTPPRESPPPPARTAPDRSGSREAPPARGAGSRQPTGRHAAPRPPA